MTTKKADETNGNPITMALTSFAVKNGIGFPHVIAGTVIAIVVTVAGLVYGLSTLVGTPVAVLIVLGAVSGVAFRYRRMLDTAFGIGFPAPALPTLTFAEGQPRRLRCVCVSDTHGKHGVLTPANLPDADVLIHAGDMSMSGKPAEMASVVEWLKDIQAAKAYKHVVVVSGNHDLTLDPEFYNSNWDAWHKSKADADAIKSQLQGVCTYLESSSVTINGVKFYGAPYQPGIPGRDMAFNRSLEERKELFGAIPADTDVLITHGPPKGALDVLAFGGAHIGCPALREVVDTVQPRFHVFGHIHESFGVQLPPPTGRNTTTTFINAATCNILRRPAHNVVVFDI